MKGYWLKCKLPSEYTVHHLDGNKMNSQKSNLSLLLTTTHQSNHNKGKSLTESHKKLIALANKKRKGIKIHQNPELLEASKDAE